jgi:hypothetical protein
LASALSQFPAMTFALWVPGKSGQQKRGRSAVKISLGAVLYVVALVITGFVVAAKYFGVAYQPVTGWIMRDAAQSLLIALGLALVSRFV